MDSLWMDGTQLPSFPALDGDLHTDVLIIGGGLCGLLCAYRLGQAGVRCALIEAERICGGWDALTAFVRESYPGASAVLRRATQDCMTLDGKPCIGRYAGSTPVLYVATASAGGA